MNNSIISRLKKQSYGNLLLNIFLKTSSILILWISSHYLSVDDFGRIALIQTSLVSFQIFASMGLSTTASKLLSDDFNKEIINKVFVSIIISWAVFSLPTSLVLYFSSESMSMYLFQDASYSYLIKFTSIIVLVSSLKTVCIGILNGIEKATVFPRMALIANIATVIFGFYFIKIIGLVGSVYTLLFLEGLLLIGTIYFIIREIVVKIDTSEDIFDLAEVKKVLRFTIPISISGILIMPANWVAMREISVSYTLADVGLINILNQWLALLIFIPVSVGTAIMPILTREKEKFKIAYMVIKKVSLLVFLVSIPILIYPEFFLAMYNDAYVNESTSIYVILLVSLAVVLSISNIINNLIVSMGRAKELLKSNLIWLIIFSLMFTFMFSKVDPVINILVSKLSAYVIKSLYNMISFYYSHQNGSKNAS